MKTNILSLLTEPFFSKIWEIGFPKELRICRSSFPKVQKYEDWISRKFKNWKMRFPSEA